MATLEHVRVRPLGRWSFVGGFLATVTIHVGLVALIYFAHLKAPPRPEAPRDLMVTQLVALGKPREKFWLPRIAQPVRSKAPEPSIKLTDDPNAAPTPKEAPRPEDADISKDLRRALQRAKQLAQAAAPEEPAEGSLTGSALGTANQAQAGDEYATQVHDAVYRNWTTPTGLISDAEMATLEATVVVNLREDGGLSNPRVSKSSGNPYFDDSCVQAIRATMKVPPPPPHFPRRVALRFDGKNQPH